MPTTSTQLVLEGFRQCTKCGTVNKLVSGFYRKGKLNGRQRYNSQCKECKKEYHHRYREDNRENLRRLSRQWCKDNSKHSRQWRKDNPDKRREYKRQRRVREAGAKGSFSEKEFRLLCERYGNVCLRCGERKELTRDHVVPLIHKGSGRIENIQPLCKSCNSSKGIKHTDYRKELPDWEELGKAT